MRRLTNKRVIEMALSTAILWEQDLIDSFSGADDRDAVVRSERLVAAYRRVLLELTGSRKSLAEIQDEAISADATTVSIFEITERAGGKK